MILRAFAVALTSALTIASTTTVAQRDALFSFHSNPWINLHYFVRAVARTQPPRLDVPETERPRWTAAIDFYRSYAKRDLLFDQGMIDIKNALHTADGKATLDGVAIDSGLKTTLEQLMPLYQKGLWPVHDRANREWIASIRPLLDRHGAALSQALARVYETSWPATPIPVDLSVIGGPSGAYATSDPAHVIMPSQDSGLRGYAGLEILFHESSHTMSRLFQDIRAIASKNGATVPPQLSHGVIFYTAGELTRRELRTAGVTEYVEVGVRDKVYVPICGEGCRDKIVEHWTPHLDGKRAMEDALSALVLAFR